VAHSTTTLQRIGSLYEEQRQLLDRRCDDFLTDAERARLAEIGRELYEKYWPRERAERVFAEHGPPRMLGGGNEHDQKRQIAHGIAPLPRGGI
jgi:hypothetical protein